MRMYLVVAVAALCFAVLVLAGCGGGDEAASPTGGIKISVKFPDRPGDVAPAALPDATNSVKVQVFALDRTTELVPSQYVARSGNDTETITFPSIPIGQCIIVATAYESYDATGRVIAYAEVQTEIKGGEITKVTLITEALVVKVEVAPSALNLEYQQSSKLTATCYDADDNIVLDPVVWTRSNNHVTVDTSGGVYGASVGATTVTATHTESGHSDTCDVTVFKRVVAYVTVDPDAHTLRPPDEETVQLTAKAYDAADKLIPYAVITWSSDDESVASVDNGGLVTSETLENGEATITASAGEGTPGTSVITVEPVGGLEVVVE